MTSCVSRNQRYEASAYGPAVYQTIILEGSGEFRSRWSFEPHERLPGLYYLSATDHFPRVMKTVLLAAEADPEGFWDYARKLREEPERKPKEARKKPTEKLEQLNLGVLGTEPFEE